ncbi:MAG: hypothetical protein FWC46_02350, partial [Actinomycetia bacterium]|nr:hypothetical protein [Actinomycetes bacterium]
VRWARAFAATLPAEFSVQPSLPHTNQFLVYATGSPSAINERLLAHAESHGLALGGPWRATNDPARAVVEFNIGDGALDLDPAQCAAVLADLVAGVIPSA